MPLWFSPGVNYSLLQLCRDQVRAEMPLSTWNGSEHRWREVTGRKAWDRYRRNINPKR
jgi:hypothetical protein